MDTKVHLSRKMKKKINIKRFTFIFNSCQCTNILHERVLKAIYSMTDDEQLFYFGKIVRKEGIGYFAKDFDPAFKIKCEHNSSPCIEVFKLLTCEILHECAKLEIAGNKNHQKESVVEYLLAKIIEIEPFVVTNRWFNEYYASIEQAYKNTSFNAMDIQNIQNFTGCTVEDAKWIYRQAQIIIDNAKEYFGNGKANPSVIFFDARSLNFTKVVNNDDWELSIQDITKQILQERGLLNFKDVLKLKDGYVWYDNGVEKIVKFCFAFPLNLSDDNEYNRMRGIMDPENYGCSTKPIEWINDQLKMAIPECNLWTAAHDFGWLSIQNLDKQYCFKKY